jgi:DNA-binding NarL/FixJ family response regulator
MSRVFLCDDTQEYRALVRAVLDAESDLEVVGEASTGPECLAEAPSLDPDLVLLDLDMPGQYGLDTLPLLRAAAPRARVAILSTNCEPEARRRACELGADGYICKPRDVFALPSAVRETLAPAA